MEKSSDFIHLPKDLPDNEHTFTLDIKGSETKTHFCGKFTYKIPNVIKKTLIDKAFLHLNSGFSESELSDFTLSIHKWTAYLTHAFIECPKWWEECEFGLKLYDYNVLDELYKECSKFYKEWMDKVHGKDWEKKG